MYTKSALQGNDAALRLMTDCYNATVANTNNIRVVPVTIGLAHQTVCCRPLRLQFYWLRSDIKAKLASAFNLLIKQADACKMEHCFLNSGRSLAF